jgi:putative ABC transport system permease protein
VKTSCIRILERWLPGDVSDAVVGDLLERNARQSMSAPRFLLETVVALWHFASPPEPNVVMNAFMNDTKFAVRLLRRAPAFTATVVITLGLAIGATTAIFSVVEPVLLSPLPYPEAGRLAMIYERDRSGGTDNVGFSTYRDMVAESKTIERAAAIGDWSPTIMGPSEGRRVHGQRVSWTYFRTLGVAPMLGRDFVQEEDVPSPSHVIISHRLWQRDFSSDSSIVGNKISIGGAPMTVVGVMPPRFYNAYGSDVEIWRVLGYADQPWTCRTCRHMVVVARLKAGVSREQAERELSGIHERLVKEYPTQYASIGMLAPSLQEQTTRNYRPALLAIGAAVLLMLLIAAANVVNLYLARAVRRQQEFAVRTALGAGRGRLASQMLAEGLVLALLGGVAGIVVAWTSLPLLIAHLPDQLPRLADIHIDFAALGAAAAVVLVIAALIGLAPAVARESQLAETLRDGRRVAGAKHLTRRVLVVGEVAVAVMLMASAALVGRSLLRLLDVDAGFDTSNLLALEVNSVGPGYDSASTVVAHQRRVRDAVAALPGVTAVSYANQLPISGSVDRYGMVDVDNPPPNPELVPYADRYAVSHDYFRMMRVPFIEGRGFTEAEAVDTNQKVIVISASLAKALWPGQNAVGKRLSFGGPNRTRTVIGIVGDVRHDGLDASVNRQFYIPREHWGLSAQENLIVRTAGDPVAMMASVRRAVKSIDPTQPIPWMHSMDQMITRSTTQRRLALVLFGAFAVAAVLLGVAGVYGVLAGSVAERTREIGVRAALGATPGDLVRMVVGQGGRMAALGIIIGVAGSYPATMSLRALLYGIEPGDPLTLLAVAVLLGVATLVACVIPARRAARVDPVRALRAD